MYKNEIKCGKIELICRCLNRLDHFSFLPTSLFMRGFFLHHLVKGISFDVICQDLQRTSIVKREIFVFFSTVKYFVNVNSRRRIFTIR